MFLESLLLRLGFRLLLGVLGLIDFMDWFDDLISVRNLILLDISLFPLDAKDGVVIYPRSILSALSQVFEIE